MNRDYYSTLGVSKTASKEDIKKAYRKLAMKFHPDRNPGKEAEQRFKEASEAYEVLSDDKKRSQYDQFGKGFNDFHSGGNPNFNNVQDILREMFGNGSSPFGNIFGGGGSRHSGMFDNIFSNFQSQGFGGAQSGFGGSSYHNQTKQDMHVTQELPLTKLLLGCTLRVKVHSGKRLELSIKRGTKPGSKMRLRGQSPSGGDLIIELKSQVPPKISSKAERLLKALEQEGF